jgi:hypothetical protein
LTVLPPTPPPRCKRKALVLRENSATTERSVVTRAYRAFVLPVRYACDVVVGPNGPKIKSEPVLGMAVSA